MQRDNILVTKMSVMRLGVQPRIREESQEACLPLGFRMTSF